MKQYKIYILDSVLFMLVFLLCSCYSDIPNSEYSQSGLPVRETGTEEVSVSDAWYEQTYGVWSEDDQFAALTDISVFPAENGFYYVGSGNIKYYDTEQQAETVLCNRAGCAHNSDDCPAYIPKTTELIVVDGIAYAFREADDGLSLLRLDPKAGERKSLFFFENSEKKAYYLNCSLYASGKIYYTVTWQTEKTECREIWVYDLNNEENECLTACDELSFAELYAAYGNHVLIQWSELSSAPPKLEDYLAEHSDTTEESYEEYITEFMRNHISMELREYDPITGDYQDAAPFLRGDSSSAPNLNFSSNGCNYGEYILYELDHSIYRYSLKTGVREKLAEADDAINGALLDGKLLYIKGGQDGIKLILNNPETGEEQQLRNDGNTEVMVFGIHQQTKNAFIGLYMGQSAWISKADYFKEKYDSAILWRESQPWN